MKLLLAILAFCALVFVAQANNEVRSELTAEEKAVAFLAREVPAWSRNNGCFSCHNDGDGARALYAAKRQGYAVPSDALNATNTWLVKPHSWEENKGDPGFSDKTLSTVQFASALLSAFDAGDAQDRKPLTDAASKLLAEQARDGAWHIEPDSPVGSPTTWGTTLTTSMAIRVLQKEGSMKSIEASRKGQQWLSKVKPTSIMTAATLLMGTSTAYQRKESLALLRAAQTGDGGWGPYAKTPPEVFDSAMALIALSEVRKEPGVEDLIQRGRRFIISQQQMDGSWIETTRPSRGESYAQRISTTSWATLALLTTAR